MIHTLSKIAWDLLTPGNFLLILLGAGLALLWAGRAKAGRRVLTGVVAVAALFAVLPLGPAIVRPLENRFPPPRSLPSSVDGIIVLGGAVNQYISEDRGVPNLNGSAERVTEFVALANRFPAARLVYTGGVASIARKNLTEASAARLVLRGLGLGDDRVIFEKRARNTHDNARLSKALIKPKPSDRWILVTSAMHMPRAMGAFRKAGWAVIPYPVDYRTESKSRFRLRFSLTGGLAMAAAGGKEWLGLLVYRLLGRTDTLFPAPTPTANRGKRPA